MENKEKKYFWLKLKEDFFKQKALKKLRNIAGGDTYTIIYLKMQLLSLKNNGKLIFDELEDSFAEELALELDETVDNIKMTLIFLQKSKLLEEVAESEFILPEAVSNIGSETTAAERMRQLRTVRNSIEHIKLECGKHSIPLMEDYNNRTRYNGHYYSILQRDNYQCCICDITEKLCVHHILGFDKQKPDNSEKENMLTLCRQCHAKVHRSDLKIPAQVLDYIGFIETDREQCSEMLESVTQSKRESKSKEIELEKNLEQPPSPITLDLENVRGLPKSSLMSEKNLKEMRDGVYEVWQNIAKQQNIDFLDREWDAAYGYIIAIPNLSISQITGSIIHLNKWAWAGLDIEDALLEGSRCNPRYPKLNQPKVKILHDKNNNRLYGQAIIEHRKLLLKEEKLEKLRAKNEI